MAVLVDTSVILDVATCDPHWYEWSSTKLGHYSDQDLLCINIIIYTEVSVGYQRIEEVEEALPPILFRRIPIPWEALFLAGKAFIKYRRRGGNKLRPLPDFYIGAHAAVDQLLLLTRDPQRVKSYFPTVQVIAPDSFRGMTSP